jgi:hypothetical protein
VLDAVPCCISRSVSTASSAGMHMRNYNDLPHLAGHGDLQCHLRHGFGQLQQKVEQSRFESGGGGVSGDLTAQSWAQPLITSDGQPGAPTELDGPITCCASTKCRQLRLALDHGTGTGSRVGATKRSTSRPISVCIAVTRRLPLDRCCAYS